MAEPSIIRTVPAPLVNPNEPEAQVNAVFIKPGQKVAKGDLICDLETTKSSFEVVAEQEGYVISVLIRRGDRISAGATICTLADQPGAIDTSAVTEPAADVLPEGVKITQPALELARELGLDLNLLPVGLLITQPLVRDLASKAGPPAGLAAPLTPPIQPFDATAAIIYGGGGHGAMVADTLAQNRVWRVVGVIDDGAPPGTVVAGGISVIGGRDLLPALFAQGVRQVFNAVAGLDKASKRAAIADLLAAQGFGFPALIHPSAHVEPTAVIEPGVQVFGQAFVGPLAKLGFGSVVNSGAIVSHHCEIGAYSHVAPGAILAGTVKVGTGVLIGMGATVALKVTIGDGARIGNGARIAADVPPSAIIPSGGMWPKG